jgi:hypothetical protein
LAEKHPKARLVLVDPIREHLAKAAGPNRSTAVADGIAFTDRHLLSVDKGPDWIVPALPVHLAAELSLRRLGTRLRRHHMPEAIDLHVPNAMRGPDGNVYTSHAAFRCPENCSEPIETCSVTKEPRKRNMYDILGDLRLPGFETLALRSHQLGPGIGGYRPARLFALIERIEQLRGGILLSTACRCHGVITSLLRE